MTVFRAIRLLIGNNCSRDGRSLQSYWRDRACFREASTSRSMPAVASVRVPGSGTTTWIFGSVGVKAVPYWKFKSKILVEVRT